MWTGREFGKLLGGAFVTAGVFALVARVVGPTSDPASPAQQTAWVAQRALAELGFYRGPLDGVWTLESSQALAAFQQAVNREEAMNLRTDGVLDQATLATLNQALGNALSRGR